MIKYIKGNLFTSKNSLAHCVSCDFKMGAGIAKEFKKRWRDEILDIAYDSMECEEMPPGMCLTTPIDDEKRVVFNMITKRNYWQKPTYSDFEDALKDMFDQAKSWDAKVVSMPKIGCGLDKLKWSIIEKMILMHQGNIEVEVYELPNK